MVQFHLSAAEHPIVSAELEALFERCAAQGVPKEGAERYLRLRFGTDVMISQLAKVLDPPVPHADLVKAARTNPDPAKSKMYALQWLEAVHKVKLGDDIEVHGWVKPREIVLSDFNFYFGRDDGEKPYLDFTGMTADKQKVSHRSNLVPIHTPVRRFDGPSERMRRYL